MELLEKPIPRHKLQRLSRKEMLELLIAEQDYRRVVQELLASEQKSNLDLKTTVANINGVLVKFKNRMFGKSSEKSKPTTPKKKNGNPKKKPRAMKPRLPSERYPDAEVVEREIEFETLPQCNCCGEEMSDSGMTENSEYIDIVPKEFQVIKQIRHKYRCGKCHGDIRTAPSLQRIKQGSSYSDNMVIDIAMSKYCDLIPIDRYQAIASRGGFPDLPPNSLIETTHSLAKFVTPAVEKLKEEVLSLKVLAADETPHKMLEGSEKSSWYLWGFSGDKACYFECHDSRSGDIASDFFHKSSCTVLISDVYAGYNKALRLTNQSRKEENQPLIKQAFCNAHSRRKFKESAIEEDSDDDYFVKLYKKIYQIEGQASEKSAHEKALARNKMKPLFEKMKNTAEREINSHSSQSSRGKALAYFLNNYDGFTFCLDNPQAPLDNNAQERAFRSPVVGRKTWYGTHSKRGAETAAKLFSLIESCKLNKINPRLYFKKLTAAMLAGKAPFTPSEFEEYESTQQKPQATE